MTRKTRYRGCTTTGKTVLARRWIDVVMGVAGELKVQIYHVRILSRTTTSWYIYESEQSFMEDVKSHRRQLWSAMIQLEEYTE